MRYANDIRGELTGGRSIASCANDRYQRKNRTPSLDKAGEALLTINEAATSLRVHEKTLYRWISERRVRAVRIGRMLRLPASSVEALCQDLIE